MAKINSIETINFIQKHLENLKEQIESNVNCELSLGHSIAQYISENEQLDLDDHHSKFMLTDMIQRMIDYSVEHHSELKELSPEEQFESILKIHDFYSNEDIQKMASYIKIDHNHLDALKAVLNASAARLIISNAYKIVPSETKLIRNEFTKLSKTIKNTREAFTDHIGMFSAIGIGTYLQYKLGPQNQTLSRMIDQYNYFITATICLEELSSLEQELKNEDFNPFFTERTSGRISDSSLKDWVAQIYKFLTEEANVKNSLSPEAATTSFMHLALEKINISVNQRKIYDIAIDIRD